MTTNVCDHCMSGTYRNYTDCHYPEYIAEKRQQEAAVLAEKILAEWPDCKQCRKDNQADFCSACGKPLNPQAEKTFTAHLLPITPT